MNISKKLIFLCATVLTAILSVGCSQSDNGDDPDNLTFEEGIPTEVRISISSRAGNQTRADGTPKDPTESIELIHDWWIAFVDKKGKVTIIKRTEIPEEDRIKSTSITIGDGFEAETFKTILPSGTYRVYSFANIPVQTQTQMETWITPDSKGVYKLQDKYINHFVTSAFKGNSNQGNDDMQWPAKIKNDKNEEVDNNIPMSGIKELVIKNTVEEAFSIEVVRGVAKVDFAFSNPTTDQITIKELKFGLISKGDHISIVPNYDAIGKGPNTVKLKNDIGTNKGTLTFDINKELQAKTGSHRLEFYCKESLGDWYDKDLNVLEKIESNKPLIVQDTVFRIDLTVITTKAGETTGTEVSKTFFTKDIKYINRNDWIHIPIKFNNWVIKWKLHFYPPIGGYPPVFEQSADGSTLSAKLTTGGEFELYPVEVSQNGTSYTVDMNHDDMEVHVTSGNDLFITEAKVIDNPNQGVTGHPLGAFDKIIAGELKPEMEGTAKVDITFYLTSDSSITDAFTCTFTITRQNGN